MDYCIIDDPCDDSVEVNQELQLKWLDNLKKLFPDLTDKTVWTATFTPEEWKKITGGTL
jgi:hypothetical protein